ncbi:unnamed protein product [Rhizophagus irregularis]|nr:unnamed protein product [Rhizophagus irregularis]
MTSSTSVTIDWSATSQHSFVQLGNHETTQDYLHNPIEDSVSDNFTDYKITTNTPTLSHTPTSQSIDNSFLISFKKFHVTRIHKAGYNKIYKFRRSKSFFFEVVDHCLDTNEIHLKIHTNDYLMSTTPIRFYFGIYIPCDHSIKSKDLPIAPSSCAVPSPIVMSNNRYGCGLHFFEKYQEKTVFTRNNNGEMISHNHRQDKKSHANLIFERWQKKETKIISSLRTGISYNSRYIVCNSLQSVKAGRTHIYNKLMNNFQHTPSNNPRTAAKQKQRFERSCRRVLKEQVIKPGAVSNVASKLAAAKKCNFLFLPSQKFTRRVNHLHYKKINEVPAQKDYTFTIPQYFPRKIKEKTISNIRTTSTIDDSNVLMTSLGDTVYSVSPYNPIPNMFIPVKYRDIIPPDPIYDDSGSFIIPGSREWFTFMYQLDLKTRDERAAKAEEARMAKVLADLEEATKAQELRQIKAQEECALELERIRLAEETRRNADALYYGSSSKHVNFRLRNVKLLTSWNNTFHNEMSNPCTLPIQKKKNKKKKQQVLKEEIDSFLINYPGVLTTEDYKPSVTRTFVTYMGTSTPLHPYTSDDTKEIEKRLLKRDVDKNSNIPSYQGTSKRSCLDSPLASDSKQAGPSNSNNTI